MLELTPASDSSEFKEYTLTEKGRGLFLALVALGQWSCGDSGSALIDLKKGKRVRLELRTEDGRPVGLDDVRLAPAVRGVRKRINPTAPRYLLRTWTR